MSESDDVARLNERSCANLARAILLSQGQFSLILVRCNYVALGEQMMLVVQEKIKEVQGDRELYLKTIALPKSASTLFHPLLAQIEAENREIDALMVFGLESVQDLDRAIAATNQVREEFRKYFPFPVVLWTNDAVMQKLVRYAPDFKSWAAAGIKFELARKEAITLWWQTTDQIFERLLSLGVQGFVDNATLDLAPGCATRQELEYARADVHAAQESLAPLSSATWEFILGRDAFAQRDLDSALHYYQNSLEFWLQDTRFWPLNFDHLPVESQNWDKRTVNPFLTQKALLLFHIGLCYSWQARTAFSENESQWQGAKCCFSASLEIFAIKGYQDLVSQLTLQLGEVLYKLEAWHELELLALYSLQQTETACPVYAARAYGFLAQVALGTSNWREAEFWITQALTIQGEANTTEAHTLQLQWCRDRALYLGLLAAVYTHQEEVELALEHLEQARMHIQQAAITLQNGDDVWRNTLENPLSDSEPLYLDILEALRSLYFQQHQYAQAFEIKQEKLALEQSIGLRSFQGASPLLNPYFYPDQLFNPVVNTQPPPEIAASGRHVDIQALSERFFRSEHKLTIVHGASGTGKSSLLCAGLVPTLWGKIIAAREVVPIIQTTYNDWEAEFRQALHRAIAFLADGEPPTSPGIEQLPIFAQLQYHCQHNRLFILIFDQFEEFFFLCQKAEDRHKFYNFLRSCLQLPFVKIILSLREDYLHYLLALEDNINLDTIDNNILDRRIRYRLTDLHRDAAMRTIELLAARSQFHLEPALIKRIVQDLSNKQGLVRPVELQVVGAALQAERITNLAAYRQLGPDPKTALVKRSLLTWVADCGPENEAATWQILYALTHEQGMRPIRTLAELSIPYSLDPAQSVQSLTTTNLILRILIGSGLVYRVFDGAEDRFQLIHDYLVAPIRQEYESRRQQQILTSLRLSQLQVSQAQKQRWQAIAVATVVFFLALAAAGLGWLAQVQRHLAFKASQNAELMALSSSAEALLASEKPFESLIESLRAVQKVRQTCQQLWQQTPLQYSTCIIRPDVQLKIATTLEQALNNILEYNQLQGHTDVAWHVRFAPQHNFLATAARDRTVKLWRPNGKLITTLEGHQDSVTSVDINRQGAIASSSWDGTVRLWRPNGDLHWEIAAHDQAVYSVRFSPDGQNLVTAARDNTAQIWSLSGEALHTLSGHQGRVYWATYSPDGEIVATASEDGTIRLWTNEGRFLRSIQAHQNAVNYVSFSPDGRKIASASHDKTAKIWSRQGQLLQVLSGHDSFVYAIEFSPDGQTLATASEDQTIRLWNTAGEWLKTLRNHSDGVTAVSFSPQGDRLATASQDKSIKLWKLSSLKKSPSRVVLKGHQDFVLDVAFSPDEETIATAARDNTAKLWTRQGELLTTLVGHTASVNRILPSPDGEMWATASDDTTVKLWSDRGRLIHTLTGHTAPVLSLAWSRDNQHLVTSSEDRTIKLWTRQGKLLQTVKAHQDWVNTVVFSPDNRFLASASRDRTIKLWHFIPPNQLKLAQVLEGHDNWVTDLAFFPSQAPDSFLVSAGYDNRIKFWNQDGQVTRILNSPTDSIARLSLHPSGQILATTTWDNPIQLWRPDDTLLNNLSGHTQRTNSVTWNQNGTALATSSNDQTAIVWNFDLPSLDASGCDWLADYFQHNPASQQRNPRSLCH